MHFNFLGTWLLFEGRRSQWGQRSLSPQTNGTGSSDLVTPCASTLVAENYLVCFFFSPKLVEISHCLCLPSLLPQIGRPRKKNFAPTPEGLSYEFSCFGVSSVFFSALVLPTAIWKPFLKTLRYRFRANHAAPWRCTWSCHGEWYFSG